MEKEVYDNELELAFLDEDVYAEILNSIPDNARIKAFQVLQEYTKGMNKIHEELLQPRHETNALKELDLYSLYLKARTCLYFIKYLEYPSEVFRIKKSLCFTREYQEYNFKASEIIEMIVEVLDRYNEEKSLRRGTNAAGLNIKKQNQALENSIKHILKETQQYLPSDSKLTKKIIDNVKDRPIHGIKKLLEETGFSYTNRDGTRYVLFEQLILAPLKIRRFLKDAIYYEKELQKSITIRKQIGKKFSKHIDKTDNDEELLHKLRSLSQVPKNRVNTYVGVLFYELFGIEFNSTRQLLSEFYTETMDRTKSKFMDEKYPYFKYEAIKGIIYYTEELPYPLDIIEDII